MARSHLVSHPSFRTASARLNNSTSRIYLHPALSAILLHGTCLLIQWPAGLLQLPGCRAARAGVGTVTAVLCHHMLLLLSGAFQRHPETLKIIIGHLGEGLQVMLPRLDQQIPSVRGVRWPAEQDPSQTCLGQHQRLRTVLPSFLALRWTHSHFWRRPAAFRRGLSVRFTPKVAVPSSSNCLSMPKRWPKSHSGSADRLLRLSA